MHDIDTDPILRFRLLLDAAYAVGQERLPEPTAFTLATVDADGRPSARVLLLKGFDERGFVFYTNFRSRKGRELLERPSAAMCFHWQHIEEQVRIEGDALPVSDAEADEYFATRPRGSQLGAWASKQSTPLETPDALEQRLAEMSREFEGRDVPRPPHWSGFRLRPTRMEFWKNRPSRLHERTLFRRGGEGDGWRVEMLYP